MWHALGIVSIAGWMLGVAAPAAQTPEAAKKAAATEARERLGFIVGVWTVEGMEKTLTDRCDWYHGRSHVVCNTEIVTPAGLRKSVSVLSYSERKGRYAYYHYSSSGVVNEMDAFIVDGALLATYERQIGQDLVREQVRMTPRGDGTLDFVEENSTNGGPWKEVTKIRYLPRSTPPQ